MATTKTADILLQAASGEKPHRLALYLPSQTQDGAALEGFEETADEVAALICGRFGGATSYAATGHFTGKSGIHRESVRVVEFHCSGSTFAEQRGFLLDLAGLLRQRLRQETMALSINGSLVLLPGGQEPAAD